MQKPGAMFLCFKQGCHQTEILEKEFRHEKTVVENCYLCHRSHSSVNEKLLNNSKENICKSCHPLLRDKNEEVSLQTEVQTSKENNSMDNETFIKVEKPQTSKEDYSMDNETFIKVEKPKTSKEHTIFTQYIKTTPVPEGNECGFCHSTLHKKLVTQLDMKICSGCHKFVQEILSSASSVPINIHQTFEEKSCCVCHDPHAAPNRYLIKQNKVRNDYTKAQPQNE
jgi:predicted CXXCH cytochrome family protein